MDMSPSSRRAWIEIHPTGEAYRRPWVALLAEGVDRNQDVAAEQGKDWVALLAEGVDRNIVPMGYGERDGQSPSSRRAWIEIPE